MLLLEGRGAIGGTWDLFRYPGIRSDSNMFTLGYSFEPWEEQKAIADGPSIKAYIERCAGKYGVDRKIRFHHRVKSASWSSADALWTIVAEHEGLGIVRADAALLEVDRAENSVVKRPRAALQQFADQFDLCLIDTPPPRRAGRRGRE